MTQRPQAATDAVVPLTNETLDDRAPLVEVPTYDRRALTPGVVHIGVGHFHRAHQAMYFDELAQRGVTDWGVVGVGLHSRSAKDALDPQDLLYTVVERSAEGDTARVVGALQRYLHAPDDPGAVLEVLADERIRLVTLTVTGAGYHLVPATGAFDAEAEEVVADVEHPRRPTTFAGLLVEALAERRRAGVAPFTVLSCDNIPSNGDAARTAVVSFARLRDPRLADWIEEHVAFPSSMVDRITPATDDDVTGLVEGTFGIDDRWPVVTEPFRQWIVQDVFCNGRPPLQDVGVQFVQDVGPYELMKKRLLNGSHCALGYLGSLAGHRTTDQVMADPVFGAFIERAMADEVAPLLPTVPGVDLDDYQRTLLERFANPRIKDDLGRLCRRGSSKVPSYLLPSIREALARGRCPNLLILSVAGWVRYLHGVDAQGEPVEIADARAATLRELALQGGTDPRPLLGERSVFGDLGDDPVFVARLQDALDVLDRLGPRAAIAAYLAPGDAAPVAEAA